MVESPESYKWSSYRRHDDLESELEDYKEQNKRVYIVLSYHEGTDKPLRVEGFETEQKAKECRTNYLWKDINGRKRFDSVDIVEAPLYSKNVSI